MNARWFNILAMIILLGAAALRLPHLATRSLWFDEAVAANNSQGTLAETIANTRSDNSSPILYPILLCVVQKLGHSAAIVRASSYISSVLMIAIVLWLGRRLVGDRVALLAALLLAVSSSQIHFAQEVREYAFSALVAALMTFAYLDYLRLPAATSKKLRLWATLALAPLVQYGLVLYAFALVSALILISISKHTVPWRDIVIAGGCLGIAGLFSLLFTLRYQWGQNVWYLQDSLFFAGRTNIIKFLYSNSMALLEFLTPGSLSLGLVVLGLALIILSFSCPNILALRTLLICAVGVAVLAAMCHAYPFGGVRQNLYLAPLLMIGAAAGLDQLFSELGSPRRARFFGVVFSIFFLAGLSAIKENHPYAEFEDTQDVLRHLAPSASSSDIVYIYYGARPAMRFYAADGHWTRFLPDEANHPLPSVESELADSANSAHTGRQWRFYAQNKGGIEFRWGAVYRGNPQGYVVELLSGLRPNCNRIWLVFSHISFEEDQRIASDLQNAGWTVNPCERATGAALYEATHGSIEKSQGTLGSSADDLRP
ncbi:MAG TPA: glycosyltransferase family 39 protein [Verrucomicrobiae bacterium]|jgi:hypothetical protein|nr:glycosyltransferase family 39 protein [Verrucomicrobiae bacterium]